MGHWLRADFQSPSGRRGHCSGHLLVPDCISGADRSYKTSSSVAFLCILVFLKKGGFLLQLGSFLLILINL